MSKQKTNCKELFFVAMAILEFWSVLLIGNWGHCLSYEGLLKEEQGHQYSKNMKTGMQPFYHCVERNLFIYLFICLFINYGHLKTHNTDEAALQVSRVVEFGFREETLRVQHQSQVKSSLSRNSVLKLLYHMLTNYIFS